MPEVTTGEEQGQSDGNVMCRMCFVGENKGSESAKKMLSCTTCDKKYHRNCLNTWSKHRDLFHWSSWSCPSCRTCEVCRRTGDPNKLMFCKRCDGAYHCYCQHPLHKNVSSGFYLCPKHTRCHSCASTVPGNGLSVRWFLGYTCCDACGRLFVKGNYCPVCLKVYRDSESTPMVCCDDCQRWVHCQCDGISEERYHQFQVDGNLKHKCAICRGECYQIKDMEDAVQELWRRRDKTDETGRSIKISLKGLPDMSPKKTKDYGKKYSHKKHGQKKGQSLEPQLDKKKETHCSSPVTRIVNHTEGICSINQPGDLKRKFVDDVMVSDEYKRPIVIRFKSSKPQVLDSEDDGAGKSNAVKPTKLVINLGPRKINPTSSPGSDTSNLQRENNLATSNGDKFDHTSPLKGLKSSGKESSNIKLGKLHAAADEIVIPEDNRPSTRSKKGKIDDSAKPPASLSMRNDSKPVLRFKLKKPSADNQNSEAPLREEEKSPNHPLQQSLEKGQRSKRKRSSSFTEKTSFNLDEDVDVSQSQGHDIVNEIMDASWILRKLGKDAIGKLVEVHQPADDTWHKGVVSDVGGKSTLSVTLNDGRLTTLDLGKQGVRFVPHKQKRTHRI